MFERQITTDGIVGDVADYCGNVLCAHDRLVKWSFQNSEYDNKNKEKNKNNQYYIQK